jgi:DNA-binding NarL/FixJ family response regulator
MAEHYVDTEPLRVVVVDDHDLFRRGLSQLLQESGIDVIGEASDGSRGVELANRLRPDVVVMDLSMPGISGVEATRRLIESTPEARVLMLTVIAEESEVLDAIIAGASGYLLKDASVEQIVSGIQTAARGESLISPRVAGKLMHRLREIPTSRPEPPREELTQRELAVLELVAEGHDNAEIAERLFISQNTVKSHVSNILAKLQVENRVQAAVRAIRGGLFPR